jgi:hypothetical protein
LAYLPVDEILFLLLPDTLDILVLIVLDDLSPEGVDRPDLDTGNTEMILQTRLHFIRRFIRIRHHENPVWVNILLPDQVGDSRRERQRLSSPGGRDGLIVNPVPDDGSLLFFREIKISWTDILKESRTLLPLHSHEL